MSKLVCQYLNMLSSQETKWLTNRETETF